MAKTIAAGIFIIRQDKKLLICHPTNHAVDFWSIPKGKLDDGEEIIDAAIRETYEETNIDLTTTMARESFSIHPLDSVQYGHKKKMIYPFLYIETKFSTMNWENLEIKCNSNVPIDRGGFPEMDDYKWVTLDEAKELVHETQVACLPRIAKLIGYQMSDEAGLTRN